MKKPLVFTPLLLIILLISACNSNNTTSTDDENLTPDEHASLVSNEFVQANNAFAFSVFQKTMESHPDENINISPLSLSIALAMTYNGAQNETANQMAATLNYHNFDLEELNQEYSHLMQSLENCDSTIQLDLANSIWIRDTFPVYTDFIETNQTHYLAEIFTAPFNDLTVIEINNWVENNTNGFITEMISTIQLDEMMFLINALYFKGDWTYSFDPEETGEGSFRQENGTLITVQKMRSNGQDFTYYFGDNLSICRMPYGDDKLAMYILLPSDDSTTSILAAEMNNET